MPGFEVTAENLQNEVLPLSNSKPVVILCWTARSAESVATLRALGYLESADLGKWALARVDIDTQAPVAQALQARTIPYGVVFIGGQAIPFLEQALSESQLREVITKILTLAAQQGIGEEPLEPTEPEEDEAIVQAVNFLKMHRRPKSPPTSFRPAGEAQREGPRAAAPLFLSAESQAGGGAWRLAQRGS
jgi:thioredoxin-like negative regulator of GroEL